MNSTSDAYEMMTILKSMEETITGIENRIAGLNSPDGPESIGSAKMKLYQVERLAIRWLALGRRMGLPDDMGKAVDLMARMVTTIRMAHIAMNLMFSTTPGGKGTVMAFIGLAGLVGASLSALDSAGGYF